VEPSELSSPDWLGESDESSEEDGGCFGANYRSSRREIGGGDSDTDSESSVCGLGGAGAGSDDEDPYAEIRGGFAEASPEDGAEVGDGFRCASPEPLPLAAEESESEEQEAHGGEDEDPTATLDPASGSDAPAPGSGLACSGAGPAAVEEFAEAIFEEVFGVSYEWAPFVAGASGSQEHAAQSSPATRPPLAPRSEAFEGAEVVWMSLEEARRRYVLSLGEEVFGEGASGSQELAAQPPPARRPRLARRPIKMTEAEVRALQPWFASRRIEPLRPPSDCGEGSLQEELAAADEVLVDLDLGAGLEVEAPAAKRSRVS
jgi:hypothetical protein